MHPQKNQSGMFIIEALVSILLFAVGIVAMVMVAAQGTGQVGQAKYRNDAAYLANELVGELWTNASGTAVDQTAWNTRIASLIPNGTGTAVISASGTQVDITIQWPDVKQSGVFNQYQTTAYVVKN